MAALVVPATSSAAVRTLSGQVVGSSYPSGARQVVPVLLDARSAKRARVRTPFVRMLVPRTWRIRVPGGQTVDATRLRAGDTFRVAITAPRRANRAANPTLVPRVRSLVVTRRGSTLSAAELQDQLTALQGYVGSLTAYVVSQFADLRGQVTALRADVNGLQSALAALQARVGQLEPALQAQIDSLIQRVSTLEGQVAALTAQLATVTGNVTTIQNLLAGVSPGDLAGALSDIEALQTAVAGIDLTPLQTQLTSLTAKIGNVGATDLQAQVDQANAALTTAQSQLTFLCSAGLVKGPLLSLSLLSACPS